MRIEKTDWDLYDQISDAANHGTYTRAEVTLLTLNLNPTELAQDAKYLVIESAYTITIIHLDAEGRPEFILGRD